MIVTRVLAGKRWRWGRLATGIAVMLTGGIVGDVPGFAVTIVGFVLFAESLYDVNLVAPLIGRPLSAERLRQGAARTASTAETTARRDLPRSVAA